MVLLKSQEMAIFVKCMLRETNNKSNVSVVKS